MLVKNLLRKRLNDSGYYDPTTMPVLCHHKWRPVMFVLIVDNFDIEYVGNMHLHHLPTLLTDHYRITQDLDRDFVSGIDLNWNYSKDHAQLTCHLSMDGYISNLILTFGHKDPTKPQIYPYCHRNIV